MLKLCDARRSDRTLALLVIGGEKLLVNIVVTEAVREDPDGPRVRGIKWEALLFLYDLVLLIDLLEAILYVF